MLAGVARTSPLLRRDVGQAEHGEEALLVLQLRRAVHLLRREARAERRRWWRRRGALGALRRRGRAPLPQHPPPLPALLLHQVVTATHRGQAEHAQEVEFLQCPRKGGGGRGLGVMSR